MRRSVRYEIMARDMVDGAYNQYLGSNKRCDEIQAAFLSKKLDSLDDIKSKRLELLDLYRNSLNVQLIKYQSTSSPHLAVLRLKSKKVSRCTCTVSKGFRDWICYSL